MATTNITIRVDEDLKRDAEELFRQIGLNMSTAINVFLRQTLREQAIPFKMKLYDDYFTGENLRRLRRSEDQLDRGITISFTMDELIAMEDGEIPRRALDFLEKHKDELTNYSD